LSKIIGRAVFDEETGRKPQAFAAVAVLAEVLTEIYGISIVLFLIGLHSSFEFAEIRSIRSWLLQHTPVYRPQHSSPATALSTAAPAAGVMISAFPQ
jgi:hypothetical protein